MQSLAQCIHTMPLWQPLNETPNFVTCKPHVRLTMLFLCVDTSSDNAKHCVLLQVCAVIHENAKLSQVQNPASLYILNVVQNASVCHSSKVAKHGGPLNQPCGILFVSNNTHILYIFLSTQHKYNREFQNAL